MAGWCLLEQSIHKPDTACSMVIKAPRCPNHSIVLPIDLTAGSLNMAISCTQAVWLMKYAHVWRIPVIIRQDLIYFLHMSVLMVTWSRPAGTWMQSYLHNASPLSCSDGYKTRESQRRWTHIMMRWTLTEAT